MTYHGYQRHIRHGRRLDDDRTTIERGLDGARPASARGSDAGRTLDARERGVRLFLSSTVPSVTLHSHTTVTFNSCNI